MTNISVSGSGKNVLGISATRIAFFSAKIPGTFSTFPHSRSLSGKILGLVVVCTARANLNSSVDLAITRSQNFRLGTS
jgi:hypothetical protein